MCHYITAICSSKTKVIEINSVGEAYGLKLEECDNEHLRKQLLSTEKYLLKTTKTCDCGTCLGEASSKNYKKERIQKSEIDKLIRKGWSETKISRYVADKKKIEDKIAKQNDSLLDTHNNELANYVSFIREVFKRTDTEVFGLLLHWYSKTPETENIKLIDRKSISSNSLTVMDLKTIDEDSLLCVTK